MEKRLKIILGVLIAFIVVELFLSNSFRLGLRACPTRRAMDAQSVGCVMPHSSKILKGYEVILTVKDMKKVGDGVNLTLNLPILPGISLPVIFRAEMYLFAPEGKRVVAVCPVHEPTDIAGNKCTIMPPASAMSIIKPGMIVAVGVFGDDKFLKQNPYYLKCSKVHSALLQALGKQDGILSYLPFANNQECHPLVGDISYKAL